MASTTDSATLLFKDITSDLLRALVTESSANQMLTFSAPLVRDFQGTKVKFNVQLVDFSLFRADGGSTSRYRSRSYERVGVKNKCQEKCAFSITEDHLSGHGVGFDHNAGTFVSCSDRIDSHCSQESQRRPVIHCQAVSKIAGSDGSYVQRDTFWPAVRETPTVVAQDQGVFPEGSFSGRFYSASRCSRGRFGIGSVIDHNRL